MIKRDDGKLNFVIEILFNVNTILSTIRYNMDIWFIHIYEHLHASRYNTYIVCLFSIKNCDTHFYFLIVYIICILYISQ